jgi:hypothetical protein
MAAYPPMFVRHSLKAAGVNLNILQAGLLRQVVHPLNLTETLLPKPYNAIG